MRAGSNPFEHVAGEVQSLCHISANRRHPVNKQAMRASFRQGGSTANLAGLIVDVVVDKSHEVGAASQILRPPPPAAANISPAAARSRSLQNAGRKICIARRSEFFRTMIPDRFATRPLRARDQLEAWREWYQPVLDVVCEQPTGHGFSAEIQLWNLGGLGVSRTTSALPVHVARAKSNLRRDPVDHWVISYCPGGGHFARTAGSDVGAPPRVPFLWSLGQEFLHERPRVDRVQFLIPRDAFRDIAPLLDASCGLPLNSPLGCLLGDYMIALLRRLPDLRAADYPGLMSAVRAMGAAAVEPSAERVALATGKSISAAGNGCSGSSAGTCERQISGRRCCAGLSACPDPISTGCLNTMAVSPGIFRASGCWKRMCC